MASLPEDTVVLLPIDASEPAHPPVALIEMLSPHKVVLLGYYPVPDQTMPGQAREQFGADATAAIDDIAARFDDHGVIVDSTVVFTRDVSKTIDNTAKEYGADAVLSGVAGEYTFDRILIPLRGDVLVEQIVSFVESLVGDHPDVEITLFNVPDDEEEQSRGEFLLRGVKDRLRESGVPEEQLTWRQEPAVSASDAILEAAQGHDLLVVGEFKPSLRDRLLGSVTTTLIDESPVPVLIVRE